MSERGGSAVVDQTWDTAPRGARALVLDRTFGTLFWGKLLSSAGVWMQGVTAAVVVYDGTGSATAVSLVTVAQSVPQLAMGPWAGALADRGDPSRQILVGRLFCVLGSAALALFFALVDPGPHLLVGVVFACSFVVGTGFVIGGPAMQSVIPELVRPDELHTAMTLNTAPMTTARIAGPALGAFMLSWVGPAASFAVSAGAHAVFVVLLVLVARMPARIEGDQPAATSMRAGLRYLRERPRLLVMLGATALLGIGTEPSLTLAPALSEELHGDVLLAGPLTLAFGIGSLAGLVGSPLLRRWCSVGQAAWAGLLTMILGMGAAGIVATPAWAFACFGVAGVGFSWGMAGFSSLLQSGTDRGFRGRVMAWWLIAFLGFRPFSSAAMGLATDVWSVRVALAISGVALLALAGALALVLWRRSPGTRFHSAESNSFQPNQQEGGRTVRALVWDGERLDVDDRIDVRRPGPGEVAVEIRMAGLCHSDVSPMEGRIPQPTPVILGHEAVGVVVESGDGSDVPVGQRVVMTVLRRCGRCRHCLDGRPTLCAASGEPVESPFSRDGEPVHQFVRLGAFAERIVVTRDQVIPVPDALSDPIAAMLGCATITAFGAVEHRARLQPGETALVTGAGGIGLNAVLAARAAGASRIVVADRNPAKEQIAVKCGATDFLVPDTPADIAPAVLDLVPGGVDTAFECAGNTGLLDAAIASLAWGGRVVVLGLPPTGTTLDLQVRALFHDKSLLGCRMGSVDPHTVLPLLAERVLAGEIDLDPLVSTIVPTSGAADLVDELRNGRIDRGFIDFGSRS